MTKYVLKITPDGPANDFVPYEFWLENRVLIRSIIIEMLRRMGT